MSWLNKIGSFLKGLALFILSIVVVVLTFRFTNKKERDIDDNLDKEIKEIDKKKVGKDEFKKNTRADNLAYIRSKLKRTK